METAGRHTFTIDPSNPTASPHVVSGNPLPDGDYNIVSLDYYDLAGHLGNAQFSGTQFGPGFTIETVTLAPTLTKPVADALLPNPMAVQFTLPEAALAGSVTLTFSNGTNVRTLHIKDGVTSLSFEVGDPGASADVTSVDGGDDIPDGAYTVTLSYQDALGNPANTAVHTDVVVDGTAPQIGIDTASPLRRAFAGALGNYTALANVTDAHPDTVEQEPEPGTTMSVGIHTITLTAKDAAGNDSSATFDLDVRPLSAVNTEVVNTGHNAPGAGTNGLPADAKLASFNTPAIDDDGNIAFVAKWTSVTGPVKKGTGLFTNAACLAIVGGDVNGITGAKYKSFTDPVISGGKVVCIATLTGTPKPAASVVVSDLDATGTLDVIARAGDVASLADGTQPVGGAKFKSFKAAAINGGSVAVFAQLTGGTAPLATTSANDYGLWVKDATNPLTLVLREGQMIDTRKIKTLIAFAPGIGSPGQGRGWLTQPHGPALLALALFTDKSQAVISATGGGGATVLTETGKTGVNGGPDISGATFASYSFPATNNTTTTFLASMTVGAGGVTKADARGVFLSAGTGAYTPIARLGSPAGATGANFSLLKDPVLGQDGGIAFPATLKATKTVKGLAVQTLWWKPPGEALKLLAQGGATTVGNIANAQWKSFTNLAIAGGGRGPIFAATLVPKKGDVTAATASGVWATDFTDAARLLFRTGVPNAIINGKTLKSFTLLKATVGNMGVTRSFNDTAQVVWLATFTDKSTAIITTEVP